MFKNRLGSSRPLIFVGLTFLGLMGLLWSGRFLASAQQEQQQPEFVTNNYKQTNLASDIPGFAQLIDPSLVNPWGIGQLATSPFWVANGGSSTATLYGGDVSGSPFTKNALNVSIPGGLPTGAVANSSTDFVITSGGGTGPARFIFASITGNIVGWRAGTVALIAASHPGRVYTGLAIGNNGVANLLYAADFANNKIDVHNSTFALVTPSGPFTDPALPAGFAPFNIQNLGGTLYVAYAKVDPLTGNDLPGPGNGFISKFDTNGVFLGRLISNGPLNSPWGVTVSPAGFGAFPNALLVGNFGDGKINAFNLATGAFLGTLNDEAGNPVVIPNLWAITFGNGVGGGDTSALYFTSGYDGERHGLFGSLRSSTPSLSTVQFSSATYSVSETTSSFDVTVTRAGDISGTSTVNYATFDGSPPTPPATTPAPATQGKDYLLAAGTLTFSAGQASKTFTVLIPDDSFVETGNETVNLALSNPNGAALGSPSASVLTITDNDSPNITPSQKVFVARLSGSQEVPTNASTASGVAYVLVDPSLNSITASVFFTGLSGNATGAHIHGPAAPGTNAAIVFDFGAPPSATSGGINNRGFTVTPTQLQTFKDGQFYMNVHSTAFPGGEIRGQLLFNEIDEPGFFAREHYYDFLNRTPDGAGLTFWTNEITSCGANAQCLEAKRVNVSAAYFLSPEFQDSGMFYYLTTKAAFGVLPLYGRFEPDIQALGNSNDVQKTAFVESFVTRPEFLAKYPASQNGSDYIDAVIATVLSGSSVNLAARRPDLVNEYLLGATQTQSRARVLRKIDTYPEYSAVEFNPGFVLMEYFGYLRRDPDQAGYGFWLTKLNSFTVAGDDPLVRIQKSDMVRAFINSAEYRQRFGPS